ncbi:MAG: serine hydrolase domain-containing protein [Enhygromyxa sp.]
MARIPLFATLAALCMFACDADEDLASELRSHPHHSHQGHPGDLGHHHGHHAKHQKPGKIGKKNAHIYPKKHWKRGAPEQQCLSSEGLAEMAAVAEQTNSTCLLVIRDGVLVGDWYWDGYNPNKALPDVWSVTKSVTSAGLGIAAGEGLLDLHESAANHIPQWRGTASEIVSIFDLVTHTSGRKWDFFSDFAVFEEDDQTAYSLSFEQERDPGSRWDYSNVGTQSLEEALENATGGDFEDYLRAKLFEPIGMTATMSRDAAGNPRIYTGLSATCPDLARFGYLVLREGRWEGRQVVPKAWIEESTSPSTELNDAYGYLWWLNNPGRVVLPSAPERAEFDGKMLPSAPDHMVMAFGAFGQMIAIDPKDEIVIVRTTLDYDMSDPMGLGDMDAILAALEDAKLDATCE